MAQTSGLRFAFYAGIYSAGSYKEEFNVQSSRTHNRTLTISLGLVILLSVFFRWITPSADAGRESRSWRPSQPPTTQEAYGKLPLYFIENRGQRDRRAAFYIQGSDKTIYFTSEGLTFSLRQPAANERGNTVSLPLVTHHSRSIERWTLKLDFVGAKRGVRPYGKEQTNAVFSYFKGAREQWQLGLKTYASIVYPDLWPGIDLIYEGTVNRLKYSFVVKPGADPNQIRLAYRGASSVSINPSRELEVRTPFGDFSDESPLSYQAVAGRQVEVATAYRIEDRGSPKQSIFDPRSSILDPQSSSIIYGFQVGKYDRSRELVIDPAVLLYCGYLGGTGSDQGRGIATDSADNVYVTGYTDSTEASFPVAVGPDQSYNGANFDAFVAKLKADGTALLYCGYIGGSGNDGADSIAVDSAGNAYVAGGTGSTQASFPVVGGPDLTFNGGPVDAFVAMVNASGTTLVYCGYLGGSGNDLGHGIALDAAPAIPLSRRSTRQARGSLFAGTLAAVGRTMALTSQCVLLARELNDE
jgi:hypothetical protein